MKVWATLKTIPTALGLILKTPIWAFNYSLNYKRARKEFKKQLIIQGIPKKEAEELAKLFPFKMSYIIRTARDLN